MDTFEIYHSWVMGITEFYHSWAIDTLGIYYSCIMDITEFYRWWLMDTFGIYHSWVMDITEFYHSQVMDTLRYIIIYKRWPTPEWCIPSNLSLEEMANTRVMHTFKYVIYKRRPAPEWCIPSSLSFTRDGQHLWDLPFMSARHLWDLLFMSDGYLHICHLQEMANTKVMYTFTFVIYKRWPTPLRFTILEWCIPSSLSFTGDWPTPLRFTINKWQTPVRFTIHEWWIPLYLLQC